MIKIFNRILWGIKPPENNSDIWFDGEVFKIYRKGEWEAITIEIDAASKLADVIKNINNVYQTKLTEGDGILLEDSKISVRRIFQVVSELPNKGDYNTIYLLVENNKEIGSYIYVNNEWMSLVSTIEIDKNLNIYSTNPVENKAVTKKIESLDVVRIVEGGVSELESGNFRDGSVGSAISSDHAFTGVTLTREHVGCTIQGVKWIYNGGLILFPNFGVNTSCTINLRNNYGDIGSIKMYYKDLTSLDIDIILPNEHITLMKNSNVFLPEHVNTVLTNKLAYYQIVGIYNNGFDVDSFAPYFQFDLTRDIRALYFKNGDWKKVLIEDNVKTINGHSILGDGNIVVEGGEGGSGTYEIKYDFLNGNPLSEEDIAFNAEVFDKLSRNEVSALYVVIDDEGYEIRLVADSFYYIPIDKDGHAEWVLLNFTTKSLDFVGLPKRAIRIDLDGNVVEFPFSGSGISFVRLSRQDEITTFYDNNTDDSLLSTLIVDDIDDVVHPLLGRIVDFSSYDITYSCSNGDVRKVYFNSDYTIKKRGLIEGVIYLGENLTDFQKQANLAYVTAMKDLNDYDYSNGNKKRVGVVVYYNGDFYNALIFDKSGIVILAGLELQGWTIDEAGNTTLTDSVNIGGADIDTSIFATKEEVNFLTERLDDFDSEKQDVISDLDTIRSGAALGATALQEHQDISHLATKEELESLTNEMIANEEVHAAAYNDLDSRLKDVGSLISGVAVTKEEFQEGIQAITNEIIDNEEVNAAALNDLNERVNAIAENVSGETATKVELQDAVTSLTNIILENEEVHAAALNDLNSRIEQIITRLNNAGL